MTTREENIMANKDAIILIKSKNAYERAAGLIIVSGTRDPELVSLIITKLFDPHVLVRVNAARALAGTTNAEAIKALYEAAEDPVAEVRRACLEAAPSISGSNTDELRKEAA